MIQPEALPCALCHSTRTTQIDKTDAKNKKPLRILVCQTCSLVQRAVIPTEAELHTYYLHSYRQDYKGAYFPKAKHVARAGRVALDRLAFLERFANKNTTQRLIDIGAGGGEFVYLASCKGYVARGVEPNEGDSQFARSAYDVAVDTATIDALGTHSANVITLFHVLEHLPNPGGAIAKIFDALEPGGVFFVEVPNILQKDASPHNIYFAAHLFYFNIEVLKTLASPYFELLGFEEEGNLRAVFRRKAQPTPVSWPAPSAVNQCVQRFHQKGWVQYLIAGRGAMKPWHKVRRMVVEARVRKMPARAILNGLLEQRDRIAHDRPTPSPRRYLPWLAGAAICALGLEVVC